MSRSTRLISPRHFHPCTIAVLVLLALSVILKLHHLGHTGLKALDESFHAVVAQNLLKHPLTPTLFDRPYLPADAADWQSSHLWLHKPPLALWTIAGSFWLFGVGAWTLRLPSLLLTTAAAWITYRIGTRLLDRAAGAIAAGLQAFSPPLLMFLHGYAFSDHVDVALIFWVELGLLLILKSAQASMVRASRWSAFAAGVTGGCAVLTKSYPGLLVIAFGAAAVLVSRQVRGSGLRFRLRELSLMIIGVIVTATPYLAYTAVRYPRQFAGAYGEMLNHVDQNVEGFGAPWDRLWFDYSADAFYVFYVTTLAAATLFAARTLTPSLRSSEANDAKAESFQHPRNHPEHRTAPWRAGVALVLCWAGIVFGTMTLAASKLPNTTAIGWPAAFLLVGALVSRAWQKDAIALGIWFATALVAVVYPGHFIHGSLGTPAGDEFGAIAREQMWIVWELLAALLGGLLLSLIIQRSSRFGPRWWLAAASILSAWLLFAPSIAGRPPGYVVAAYNVTALDREEPALVEIGAFARTLPRDGVLLLAEQRKLERITLMFYANRTVYAIDPKDGWQAMVKQLVASGARPYIVTPERLPLPLVFTPRDGGRRVYRGAGHG